jgi:putative endonuclease
VKTFYVYMLCNRSRTVLYTGITNSLQSRLWYHQHTKKNTFVKRYRCDRLVYYECYDLPGDAISREKEIKRWRREKKNDLVRQLTPCGRIWGKRSVTRKARGPSARCASLGMTRINLLRNNYSPRNSRIAFA